MALRERRAPTVLTPHEGELGRLLEIDSEEVRAHRLRHARAAAERSGAILLLKGDDTIVAAPGGPVAINPSGTPALATAGTGDVLSGLIGVVGETAELLPRGPAKGLSAAVVEAARAVPAAARRAACAPGDRARPRRCAA